MNNSNKKLVKQLQKHFEEGKSNEVVKDTLNYSYTEHQDLKELNDKTDREHEETMNNLDTELKELERLENEEIEKIKNYYDN